MKYSIFIIISALISCNNSQKIHNYTYTKYLEKDLNYTYSDDVIKYNDKLYHPLVKVQYMHDTLSFVSIFKPEGYLDYTKADLLKDTLLMNGLNIPERQVLIITNDYINAEDKFKIIERSDKVIYGKNGDTLIILSLLNNNNLANKTKVTLNKNIKNLYEAAYNFEPAEISLSMYKDLNRFDVNYILNTEYVADAKITKNDIVNILLLKLYLYHLKNQRQGYDLLTMRTGQAKYVIDYFLKTNNLNNLEFVNSVALLFLYLKNIKIIMLH